jgi:ABC-2 type transport system permease protein
MRRLIASEALKLRTTRTFYAVTLGSLALALIVTTAIAFAGDFEPHQAAGRQPLAAAGIVQVFALILGILAVTTEFRHGTITPTLLVTTDRRRLMAAKLVAHVLAGLVIGLISFGAGSAIALTALSLRDVPSELTTGEVLGIVAGGTAGTGLFAVLGVGLGALVRNQVGAIVAALAWVYALEPLLGVVPGIGDAVQTYGFGALSSGLSGTVAADPSADLLGQLPAGGLLAAYALVVVAAGTALLRRRDVG